MGKVLAICATIIICVAIMVGGGMFIYYEQAGYIDIDFQVNYTNYDEDQAGVIQQAGGI